MAQSDNLYRHRPTAMRTNFLNVIADGEKTIVNKNPVPRKTILTGALQDNGLGESSEYVMRFLSQRLQATAQAWSESLHPRWPAGRPEGGQFRPTDHAGSGRTEDLPSGKRSELVGFSNGFPGAVVDKIASDLRAAGNIVVKEPYITYDGELGLNNGYPDLIIRDIYGYLSCIEVKTGLSPRLTSNQTKYYVMMEIGNHVKSFDPRIRELGLVPGQRLPPIRVYFVHAPEPGKRFYYYPLLDLLAGLTFPKN